MELGDINDLPSEEAKIAFLEFMEGRCECDYDECPFQDVHDLILAPVVEAMRTCKKHCGKLFPTLPNDELGYTCPCYAYGIKAIKAAQIMVDVYLGYK